MILCMYVTQSDHFRLTIWQSFYDKDLAGWPMSNFVESVYFNLIFRLCNKIKNYNLCHIACSIFFFIQLRAKASVFHSIAQQLFFVAGWRQTTPGNVNCSWIERVTSEECRRLFGNWWDKSIHRFYSLKAYENVIKVGQAEAGVNTKTIASSLR